MPNVVTWFEIAASDFNRALTFYNTILDISLDVSEIYGYPTAFFPNSGDGVTGALVYSQEQKPSGEGTVIYFNVKGRLDEVLTRIEPAGGRIKIGKTSLGEDMGHYAIFYDTEENIIGLHASE